MLMHTQDYREFLREELARRAEINPRYSQRSFARYLGMSPGELSEVLRDRRALSAPSAMKIVKAMGLSSEEAHHLLLLIQLEKTQIPQQKIKSRSLSETHFRLISDWVCFAIINLASTAKFRFDETWIARRLGVSKAQVQTALSALKDAGLIEVDKNGTTSFPSEPVEVLSDVPSAAIRKFHLNMLQKAIEALDMQSPDERDISGVGFAVETKRLSHLKKDISDFLDLMADKYNSSKADEVYQCEVALFRLTEKSNEK